MRWQAAIRIAMTLGLVAAVTFMACAPKFYAGPLTDGIFAFNALGLFVIFVRMKPRWSSVAISVILAAIFALLDFKILGYAPELMAWVSLAGLGGFLTFGVSAIWERASERNRLWLALLPALGFLALGFVMPFALNWLSQEHPRTLDLYLLSFDASLRVQLVSIVAKFLALRPWFLFATKIVYVALPLPLTLVYAGLCVRSRRESLNAMLAFAVTAPLGAFFYNLFPACGPVYLFRAAFPFHMLSVSDVHRVILERVAIEGARNAMPSLHVAWALLAFWYARKLSRAERMFALAFVPLTMIATIGIGQHWFVDLVVAFPFALLVESLWAYKVPWRHGSRYSAFLVGLLAVLAWITALRFSPKLFWTSPLVPWALVAATVAVVIVRHLRLGEAVKATSGARNGGIHTLKQQESEVAVCV
jgi:PAP2 superfamily